MPKGVNRLTQTFSSLKPTLAFLTPVQTQCNYVSLFLRNVASLLSVGDANGTWQRFIHRRHAHRPQQRDRPLERARQRSERRRTTCTPTTYPNTASPGQTKECEAGNEAVHAGQDRDRQRAGQPGACRPTGR